ncbi:MAG: class I SAM-dependent methyltransferase [Nitrospinota bacterium]|nr:class I SAM-dependent methyltransferase [Nitrospinota bacterium]
MSDPTKFDFKSSGTLVAQVYEELLVPRIFEPWSKLLLTEARLSPGESVLDVACGPGTVARMASITLGPKGKVTAIDISPPMLDIARAKSHSPERAPIEYMESPAVPLKADDATFDVTLCQQGLQFFPEKVEALKEMARVTRPGGRIALAVWGSLTQNPIFGEICAGLDESLPSSIADMMKAPFSLSDPEQLRALGEEAGLKDIEVKTCSLPVTFERGVDQAIRVLDATPLAPQIAELPSEKQEAMVEILQDRLKQFLNGDRCVSSAVSNILMINV